MWTTFFFALLAILCSLSALASLYAALTVRRMTGFPRAALASLDSKLRSIEASHLETMETVAKLAQKYKMQKVRNAVDHVSDPPTADDYASNKDELRKRAGLTAGKPARHQ